MISAMAAPSFMTVSPDGRPVRSGHLRQLEQDFTMR
jgi:hypothetical protein